MSRYFQWMQQTSQILALLCILCLGNAFFACQPAQVSNEPEVTQARGDLYTETQPRDASPEESSQPTPEQSPESVDAGPEISADQPQPEHNAPDATAPSRCAVTGVTMTCDHTTTILWVGAIPLPRTVYWQIPQGTPPKDGWPVAIMFQGSLFSSKLNWIGVVDGPFGVYHQVSTLKTLLDAGYAVLTPVVKGAGTTFWDTNIPPYSSAWTLAPDHLLMVEIFKEIEKGTFGPLNGKRMYALGISSGGYMSSRMAVSYPGKFKALAIHSASYATCAGSLCQILSLPADHPPTLFLHGRLDPVVPIQTMLDYRDKLQFQKTPHKTVIDEKVAHEWISAAPQEILAWFQAYP